MIRLKKIGLEGITNKEYNDMHIWWEGCTWLHEREVYSRVTSPICFEVDDTNRDSRVQSYYSIVLELLKHKDISSLTVYDRGIWIRVNKSEGGGYQYGPMPKGSEKNGMNEIDSDLQIEEMARIAAMDRFHHAYMEVRIGYGGCPRGNAWVGFIEYETLDGKRIIGYQVNLCHKHRVFFNVKNETSEKYRWNRGLWVPENYKDLPSPAAMRKG